MFKSEDEKRRDAAITAGRVCDSCHGTGTVGIGGRGAATSSKCSRCNGSGMKR
jgi:DnaJ-class molecular chaperone